MPSRKDQKNTDTSRHFEMVSVDLNRVDDLMSDIIHEWERKVIHGKSVMVLDTCNACSTNELNKLMVVWPEEVLALCMHQMARSTEFMENLFGKDSEAFGEMLDQLTEIRQEKESKERQAREECKDTIKELADKFRSAVH